MNYRRSVSRRFLHSWLFSLPPLVLGLTILVIGQACSSAPKVPPGVYTVRNEAARLILLGAKALRDGDGASYGFYLEAYRLYTATDNAEGRIRALDGLGRCLLVTGQLLDETEAITVFTGYDTKALWTYAATIAAASGKPDLEALAALLRIELSLLSASPAEARQALLEAETAAAALKNRPTDRAWALRLYATAAKSLADYQAALKALDEAAKINLNNKAFADHAADRHLSASIYSKMGDFTAAKTALLEALDSDRRVEHAAGIASDYFALGLLAEKVNDQLAASQYYRRAEEIYAAARLNGSAPKI